MCQKRQFACQQMCDPQGRVSRLANVDASWVTKALWLTNTDHFVLCILGVLRKTASDGEIRGRLQQVQRFAGSKLRAYNLG